MPLRRLIGDRRRQEAQRPRWRIVGLILLTAVGVATFGEMTVGWLPGRAAAAPAAAALKKDNAPLPDKVLFNRDIRPILSENCYKCHGPDKASRQAGLRLDQREAAIQKSDDAIAIVPGKSRESALVKRIASDDADEHMPPTDSGKHLTERQVALLTRWIDQGAAFEPHWSLIAPQRVSPPQVTRKDWPRNAIDNFILARLEGEGMHPSPEADRRTLIRRATLDLTGLPPTQAEVQAFLDDKSATAYEKVVDRLLASPRYGEHMAVEWLDAARYSDTNGYQADTTRTMWPWRDWVIGALNNNMPFDQFTIEQLAGDLLPGATSEQKLATGFHRNLPLNGEGGRIPEESRVDYVMDRVDTTGAVWLGMTVGCCRCHDHKFDPLAQRDYYQFYAFFNNIAETGAVDRGGNASPVMQIQLPNARLPQIEAELVRLEKELSDEGPQRRAAQARWEADAKLHKAIAVSLGPWQALGPFEAANGESAHDRDFGPESGREQKGVGEDRPWREHKLLDGELNTLQMPANSAFYLRRTITASQPETLDISLGSDDGIKVWLTGDLLLNKKAQRAVAADQDKLTLHLKPGENKLLIKVNNDAGPAGVYFAALAKGPPAAVNEALKRPPNKRTTAQREAIAKYYRESSPEFDGIRKKIAALKLERSVQKKGSTLDTMIMAERPDPRPAFVLLRGQYDNPDKKQPVSADVPKCMPRMNADLPKNRLGLARWLVDPANPLASRVVVNRYWQRFFGTGLVKTTDDFGSQGEAPSHPEMLDYLATEFIALKWDVKAMQRLMVTSATYRQSSHTTPELLERDPYNRLLARAPRFRLGSLALRDQALALSGLLIDKVGGPPVKPYQPAGVWLDFSLGKIDYTRDKGEGLYRRSIYTFWRRSVAPTMFFDISDRLVCTVRQSRTNSPLHALTLLNDVTYVEAARAMATRLLREADTAPAARIERAFEEATSRPPTAREREVLLAALQRARAHYQADPQAAQKMLTTGDFAIDSQLSSVELASYTAIMNVILNLDEVLTRE